MKKTRLLVDAHVFDNGFQGTTSFIKGLYNQLVLKDDLQIILAAKNIDGLRQFFDDPRFEFIQLRSNNRFQRLLVELPAIIKKLQIDFAHFQYIVPPVKQCRYIVTIHDLLFKDFPHEFPLSYKQQKNILFKRAAVQADILTTVSSYSTGAIQRHFKIDAGRIVLTPNAVDPVFFQSFDKRGSAKIVDSKYVCKNFLLYVSRIEPRKNHELLVNAFVELGLYEQNFDLVMIGQKSIPSAKLDSIIKNLPTRIKERIHWLENIPEVDLVHFYNAASLFVYPSKAEGFGIPPLEAAALKTPVLCSNATAMQDFVFFKDRLFNPNDETDFRKKLIECLHEPLLNEDALKVAEEIKKRYSWQQSAENLYQAIMNYKNGLN